MQRIAVVTRRLGLARTDVIEARSASRSPLGGWVSPAPT
jgi:hypothetical protein